MRLLTCFSFLLSALTLIANLNSRPGLAVCFGAGAVVTGGTAWLIQRKRSTK